MSYPPYIAYIGYPRTATTFLQSCFYAHPEICYLHKNKSFSKPSPSHSPDNFRCVVEGDEGLCSNLNNLHRIKKSFPEGRIIISIRRQDEAMLSFLGRRLIRDWKIHDYPSLLKSSRGAKRHEALNYQKCISLAWELFEKKNVLVLVFDDLKTDSQSYCQQVWAFLGVKNIHPKTLLPEKKINESILSPRSSLMTGKANQWIEHLPMKEQSQLFQWLFSRSNPACFESESIDPNSPWIAPFKNTTRFHRLLSTYCLQPLDFLLLSHLSDPKSFQHTAEQIMSHYLESNQKLSILLDRNFIDIWHSTSNLK